MESRKIYNIVITPMAAKDLNDTYDYIAAEYGDRMNASKIYASIVRDINKLDTFPEMYALVGAAKARKLGVRRKVSGSRSIIYVIHKSDVMILHVYSNSMDIDARLSNLDELFGK